MPPWALIATMVSFAILLVAANSAEAAILILKGNDTPHRVRTIRVEESSIEVGFPQGDGSLRTRVLQRSEIKAFYPTVSEARLTELSPDKPAAYRIYAEELAEKRNDPDAQATGIRLYLIAAHLDSKNLARGCLLGMAGMARNGAEERKFRAMVYLLDPAHDRSLLAPERAAGATAGVDQDGLLDAIRKLRRGQGRAALHQAEKEDVKAALLANRSTLPVDDFTAACNSADPLTPVLLARLLRLELMLSGDSSDVAEGEDKSLRPSWSQALASGSTQPTPTLTWQSLTEFDPHKNVYRDGNWVEP